MSSFWRTPDGVFGAGGSSLHMFDSVKAAEGYGNYSFAGAQAHHRRSMGQLPPGVTIEQVIENMDQYIILMDGIQVARTEVQQPVIEALDSMSFSPDGGIETGSTIRGTANWVLFDITGSDFASDYLKQGYAILVDKASIQDGVPRLIMTQQPQVITDNAFEQGPYVVVAGPPELIAAAGKSVTPLPPPGVVIPPEPPPGGVPVPTTPPGVQPASAGAPEWVLPAVIGVGALALVAAAASFGGKKGRR